MIRPSSSNASSEAMKSTSTRWEPASPVSRVRLVTSTPQVGEPGSSCATCDSLAASSSTTSTRWLASMLRYMSARSSTLSGSVEPTAPSAERNRPSTSAGRRGLRLCAAQVAVELPVGVVLGRDAVCHVDRERALADARLPRDVHHRHRTALAAERFLGACDEILASDEVRDGRRQLMRVDDRLHGHRDDLVLLELQYLVVGQDRGFEPAQVVAGFEPEVLDEDVAATAVDIERLRLPAGTVEGEHELAAWPLPQRVLGDHALQFTDQRVVPAEQQFDVDAVLEDAQPLLVQPKRLVLQGWAGTARTRARATVTALSAASRPPRPYGLRAPPLPTR